MGSVTVGTACNLFRESETVVLAVVAVHVGLHGDIEDVVASHHLLVAMALHADLGVEFPYLMRFSVTYRLYFMEVMAVVAGGGVLIAGGDCFAVNGVAIDGGLVVTLDALRNCNPFLLFPIPVGVDVGVAVSAHYFFLYVNAVVMLCIFLLVATLAVNLADLYFAPHVSGEVGDLHVAARTGILAMYRSGKGGGRDLVAVAAETGGRIDGHSLLCCHRGCKPQGQDQRGEEAVDGVQHTTPPMLDFCVKKTFYCRSKGRSVNSYY